MRRAIWSLSLCGLAFAAAGEPGPAATSATSLTIAEPAFRDPRVMVATSMPPQFDLLLDREMPTPGWSFAVDAVVVDADEGRITVRLTEVAPTEPVAQVLTTATCRVGLGTLARGSYWLDLWLRHGADASYARAQSFLIHAR